LSFFFLISMTSWAYADRVILDLGTVPGYTPVEVWASGQTLGNGYQGSNTFVDVIGNPFSTDRMTISNASVSPFTIQIWTNNQPGGWVVDNQNLGVADIAINSTPVTASYDADTLIHFPGAVSDFNEGIDMQAYLSGTPGQAGAGVAYLGTVSEWGTSFSQVNPLSGFNYGGAYGSGTAPVETRMLNYNVHFTGTISWVVNDSSLDFNNNIPDYLITVSFPNLFATGDFEYLWGTTVFANDVIHAPKPVPEPATWLFFSLGLIGLVGFGRKKFRN
jgi:hypothetical protein